jgi:small subunit ribosomal protein S9
MATTEKLQATGRRKTAIARVRLITGGEGNVRINGRTLEEYFPRDTLRAVVLRPLMLTDKARDFSVDTLVDGGGIAAQAGAISHGISRCLLKVDLAMRGTLKKDGLLTRDPRMKERKKYGQKGARKRFQFSKR